MQLGPRIGVMGSAGSNAEEFSPFTQLAADLGRVIAEKQCVLITGATTGLPHMVSCAARSRGALTVGVSPAINLREHVEVYRMPSDGCDVIIYTGFGLKGRNVINIRSSDVVIIFGGGMGTLNEFTIAYDEGKVIGVLEGTGGISDHIQEIVEYSRKSTQARIFFDDEPEPLIAACLRCLESPTS